MPQPPKLILCANPAQEREITMEHAAIAHMAYRVDPGPMLMRASGELPGQGGLLYFSLPESRGGNTGFFLQQVGRECMARKAVGVVADLGPGLEGLAGGLDRLTRQRGLSLYVPELYHDNAPHARLLVSTAVSGGSLRQRLEEAAQTWGRDRVVPALERIAADFTPPQRSGQGRSLSPEELRLLRERLKPGIFWSPELRVRYFTYFDQGQTHFVLFDDGETLRAKLRLIGELGFGLCLAAWGDLAD